MSNQGIIKVETKKPIVDAQIEVKLDYGSQTLVSPGMKIEVFDCQPFISLTEVAKKQQFHVGDQQDIIEFRATTSADTKDCKVDSYAITGSPEGVKIDSKTGQVTLDES